MKALCFSSAASQCGRPALMLVPPIVGLAVFLTCLSAHAGRLIIEEEPAAAAPLAPAQAAPPTRAATDHVAPIPAPSPAPLLATPAQASMPMTAAAVAAELPAPEFRLAPPETVRAALERWSKQAGWVFGPDLWAAPVDIPVVTSAAMGSDYRAAVRKLLDATSLTDVPLQPCFYSNRVLRVVSRSQLCDRL